jgi:two-component system NtrC family sensor kinase
LGAARREITEWSQKLEDKVLEKTSELSRAQRQVLHMEKMASLGKLSATVAHELNNPLSGMLTFARLVRRDIEKQPIAAETREELSRYLRLVEKECSRCGSIVQNLLVFTRRMNAETTVVDLNEIVEQSVMLIQHHLQLANIELSMQLVQGDATLVADGAQVQQAIVALLVNAVEAIKDSGKEDRRLSVDLEGNADELTIHIEDTGVGIPPEVLPHIFEPFFSTKHAESGVGLGLSVVYGIVERHEGRIEVDSQVGRGTIFHVHLPRKANVKAAPGPGAAEPSPPGD